MILNDRKIKILEAIISDYIRTAEPIGSRTIAKKYDLGVSSATIRNEMSDLEEMGLIVQPHASSGRVPSDKGYRLYVNELMRARELSLEESDFLQQLVTKNIGQIDFLMQETAKALAMLTKYTTIVSEPKIVKTTLKHVQFVPLDENTIVMVIVTDNKVAKNHVLKVSKELDYQKLSELSLVFNNMFSGLSIKDIISEASVKTSQIAEAVGVSADYLEPIWQALSVAIQVEESVQIYTSGAKNILEFPEFSDIEKARAIFNTLEEKELLITILGNGTNLTEPSVASLRNDLISVVIGSENNLVELKNCSIIKANYNIGNEVVGSIGVIGPTRMDYPQVVSVLANIVKNINSVLKGISGG